MYVYPTRTRAVASVARTVCEPFLAAEAFFSYFQGCFGCRGPTRGGARSVLGASDLNRYRGIAGSQMGVSVCAFRVVTEGARTDRIRSARGGGRLASEPPRMIVGERRRSRDAAAAPAATRLALPPRTKHALARRASRLSFASRERGAATLRPAPSRSFGKHRPNETVASLGRSFGSRRRRARRSRRRAPASFVWRRIGVSNPVRPAATTGGTRVPPVLLRNRRLRARRAAGTRPKIKMFQPLAVHLVEATARRPRRHLIHQRRSPVALSRRDFIETRTRVVIRRASSSRVFRCFSHSTTTRRRVVVVFPLLFVLRSSSSSPSPPSPRAVVVRRSRHARAISGSTPPGRSQAGSAGSPCRAPARSGKG